jgi:tropomyosin, fungi type
MASLRAEADNAIVRAEEAEAKNKKLEQLLLEKDQEITSLNHRLGVLDGELEKAETKITEYKQSSADGESSKQTSENLTRKVQLLEDELDNAEKNNKETIEKSVFCWRLEL